MSNPGKPKYYKLRLYARFFAFFVFIFFLNLFESTESKVVWGVVCIGVFLVFRFYFNPKEVEDYFKYEEELERQKLKNTRIDTNVDENIAKYLEMQRIKRQNAKWWQFWL